VNAAEHLQLAVQLLAGPDQALAREYDQLDNTTIALAQAHALCALAIELGVPAPALSVSANVTPIKRPASQPDNGSGQDDEQEATG